MPDTSVTKIPATQDALKAALEARTPAMDGVAVDVGWPPKGPRDRHVIISGAVDEWSQEWSTSGDAGMAGCDERFTLTVVVFSRKTRKTFAEVRDDAVALVREVQGVFRDDHTLGGVLQLGVFTGGQVGESYDAEKRESVWVCTIRCEAYLT